MFDDFFCPRSTDATVTMLHFYLCPSTQSHSQQKILTQQLCYIFHHWFDQKLNFRKQNSTKIFKNYVLQSVVSEV